MSKIDVRQFRFIPSAEIKINAEKNKIGGYSVLYGVETKIGNWFREEIQKGVGCY